MKCFAVLFSFFLSSALFGQASLDWLTYFGVQNDSYTYSRTHPSQVVFDSINNYIYVAGVTSDTLGIATSGAHQEQLYDYDNNPNFAQHRDMFLSKWDTAGNLVWSTYYGGSGTDRLSNMALDADGNIILTGSNEAHTNITTPGAFQEFTVWESGATNPNIFLAKFSQNGTLLWSTYFGLGGNALYSGLAIDTATNDIYITGTSTYEGLGTSGTFQPEYFGGHTDGFIAKFSSAGNRIWCTYLGGEDTDQIYNITLSKEGYLYVSGGTISATNIASPGAEIDTRDANTNNSIGFLAKFDTLGNRIWSTFLGGDGSVDRYFDIKTTSNELTGQENIFVYGLVGSTDLGTIGTYGADYGGGQWDMILLKYNELGQKQWGTYIGGNSNETTYLSGVGTLLGYTNSMVVEGTYGNEELQIAGGTQSTDFYFDTECSYVPHTGNYKGFITSLDTTGNLNWSKPFDEGINSISLIGHDSFYATGVTDIDGLATSSAYKETKEPGSFSGFIAKLDFNHCLRDEFLITEVDNVLYAPFNFFDYQWTKNGTDIPEANNEYLELNDSEPAIYSVKFRDDCNCMYISSEYNTNTMSVQDPVYDNAIRVYPNPADDFIQIVNLKNNMTITIYNLIGQQVFSKLSNENHETISVSYLASGVYILGLSSVDEENKTFIKFTKT
ncbi:T9SS type A sorting domain-containing protein [Winogradskyella psychrotolerans]|uniref:T9SS type A sorting domain-containing protein n=1 Tax=Winogradskyella psychrotolerans TaxID=1344585 RepID=UPI001C073041|nr:T9SS type A sorting domain-containing protein [Winogradskyella psychrotolerans]MBU2922490.1 T9SS type A sorting domain-containing protein [Winogradskyella psychrotolerans]